jgi:hypothetical protein
MTHFIDVFLHLDMYLDTVIQQYGVWLYFILFVVVFLETGVLCHTVLAWRFAAVCGRSLVRQGGFGR